MEHKSVAVRREDKRNVECRCVLEALLNSVAYTMCVVFGFDDREWDAGLVVQNVVGALGLPTTDSELAARTMMRPLVKLTSSRI